jgi:hypothetical protein
MCLSLGGMVALGMAAAPAIFQTARHLQVQVPNLPPAANAPNYLGGQIFGSALAHFAPVEYVCIALILLLVALETTLWLDRNNKWVIIRLLSLLPLIAATILFAYAAFQVRHASDDWIAALRDNNPGVDEARRHLDFWHAISEKIELVKVLSLFLISAITAWGLPLKKSHSHLTT